MLFCHKHCRQAPIPGQIPGELLRIGGRLFPFPISAIDVCVSLFFNGRTPVIKERPYSWYDMPNIHFCTIADFLAVAGETGVTAEEAVVLNRNGQHVPFRLPWSTWNLPGQQAVFLLQR